MKDLTVFRRHSSVAFDHTEPFIRGAERVATMRVLGTVINSRLTMKDHLDHLLFSCASSIYALRMLRVHGLQDKQIHVVASMTTLASMLLCISSIVGIYHRSRSGSYRKADVEAATGWLPTSGTHVI